ncbi:UNVERIFIED_ORG: putative transcriptional regulator [Burkholderia sp. 1263]
MLSTVLRRLDQAKGAWPEIARASGVPYQTLTKIACRIVSDPRVSTVQTLFDYFAASAEQPAAADCAHTTH